MKKVFTLILALLLLFSFAACGEPAEEDDNGKESGKKPGTTQTTTTQPQELGTKTIYVLVSQTTTRYEDGTPYSTVSITNEYDANGLLIRQIQTDEKGNTLTFTAEHDKYGRVKKLTCTEGSVVRSYTYKYDRWGNVVQEHFDREVDYLTKSWSYDADGNLLSYEEKDPFSTVSEEYRYENGRLCSIVKYRGKTEVGTRVYDYDTEGRIAKESYYDPGKDTPFCTYVYSYSDDGLTTYADRNSKNPTVELRKTTVMDANGNIIREEENEGGRVVVIEYTYQAIEVPADYPRKN